VGMQYVMIYLDWPERTRRLSDAEKGRLMDAVMAYARGQDPEPLLQGNEQFLFDALRLQLDRDRASYGKAREQRAAAARSRWAAERGDEQPPEAAEAEDAGNSGGDLPGEEAGASPAGSEKDIPAPRGRAGRGSALCGRIREDADACETMRDDAGACGRIQEKEKEKEKDKENDKEKENKNDKENVTPEKGPSVLSSFSRHGGNSPAPAGPVRRPSCPPARAAPSRILPAQAYSQRDYTQEEIDRAANRAWREALEEE